MNVDEYGFRVRVTRPSKDDVKMFYVRVNRDTWNLFVSLADSFRVSNQEAFVRAVNAWARETEWNGTQP